MKKVLLLFCLVIITGTYLQAQTVNVTFQVDMRVKIATGYFDPATDVLTCPGGFNNWLNEPPANTEKVMSDDDNDSVYTFTIAVDPNQTYEYKFNVGLGWEGKDEFQGQPNRSVVVGNTDMTVGPFFFNNYTAYTGVDAAVTFNVDMRVIAQSTFDPSAHNVFVAGNFTNWQNNAVEMEDLDGDTVYTVTIDTLTSGDLAIYKFVYSPSDAPSGTWESPEEGDDIFGNDNNRIEGIADTGTVITRLWNNQEEQGNVADGNIFFEVDMSVLTELGVFNPDVDSVQIRGGFNGWNDSDPARSLMNQNPVDPNNWYLDVPFVATELLSVQYYKYFIKNGAGSTPYANTGWEVSLDPTDSGNRDRPIIFQGIDNQEAGLQYYDGIRPDWVIPTGTTVECEFMVDMTYATLADSQGASPVFIPGVDSVFWLPQLPLWYAVNGVPWPGEYPRVLELTDPDQDMIYTGTLVINGPSFNGFMYNYGYSSVNGLIQEAGAQVNHRVRFVSMKGPREFDSPYQMPLDVWSNGAKPEEAGPVLGVQEVPGVPVVYSLEQNYPNPFNPSTMVRFSIPEAGLVTLKVYNLLGESVATLVNQEMKTGTYEISFDAAQMSSGIYFYTITAGNFAATKKMILLK